MKRLTCAILLILASACVAAAQTPADNEKAAATTPDNGRALEGCVVRQDADVYLQPAGGARMVRLAPQNGLDLTQDIGQWVKVRGSVAEASAGNGAGQVAAKGSSPQASQEDAAKPSDGRTANSAKASGADTASASASADAPPATTSAGTSISQLPQSAQAGSGTPGFHHGAAAERDFLVTSVDVVSTTCPAGKK